MKRYTICIIGLLLISLLSGCGAINVAPDTMTITLPDGEQYEVADEELQNSYLDIFDRKQKLKNMPGYLSVENKYTVDYDIDGQTGFFEFYIQPSPVEVMVELNDVADAVIADIVYEILDVTDLEMEDLVFKDSFGFLLEVREASYKKITFEYVFNVAGGSAKPAGIAFPTTLTKFNDCKRAMKRLQNSGSGIKRVDYQGYDYPKTPEALHEHIYKSFVTDNAGKWYRISDKDISFLISQDEIYNSLRMLKPNGKSVYDLEIDVGRSDEVAAELEGEEIID